jgi:hypothetical protein
MMQRLLFLLIWACQASLAQAAYYDNAAYPFAWINPASHTKVVWTGASGGPAPACTGGYSAEDDDITEELPLGFTFNFGGTGYTSVRIMSNGRLQFNNTYCYYGTQTVSPRTYTLPYANNNLSRTLRIYGADLDPTVGGAAAYVSHTQSGSAPNRRFVVTWKDIRDYDSGSSRFNLQAILLENGDFIYQFENIANSTGGKAQSGWQLSPSDYDSLGFNDIEDLQNSAVRFFRANTLADWAMEGNFTDSSGNGHNGTGVNGAATAFLNDPAYTSGGQSTCQYAQLDTTSGGEKRYIQLSTLAASTFNSSFTVMSWLRSTHVGASGQRIFVNDDNQNGWALSLGDGGSGKIRLFNRNQSFSGASGGGSTSGVIFDTPGVVTNNRWYFLAATVDLYLQQATLYVYDSTGVQVAKTTAAFNNAAWCPTGQCTGAIALGGETLASAEGVSPNFHFKGHLDEVRLWQGILPQSHIESALRRTRPCSAVATPPGGFNAFESGTAAGAIAGPITTKVAGSAFNLDLVALNTPRTAPASSFTGAVLVDLIANTAPGVALDGNNCPVTGTVLNVGTANLTSSRGTQAFPAVANVWRDVRVRMRHPATGTASIIACSSDNFAVKPASLSAMASDADWQSPGTARTLNATGASATPFHKAGQPFTLRLAGYNAGGGITSQYDGSPSAQVNCVLPASGCVPGTLTPGAFTASGGTVTSTTARYGEVGAVSATFIDANFAAEDAGDTAASCAGYQVCSAATPIGRFVPDHFDVAGNTPAFAPGCGGFTYLGQAFGFGTPPLLTVTAKNQAGGTTVNYTGALWKITPATLTGQAWSEMSGTVQVAGTLPAPGVTDLGVGRGTLALAVGNPGAGGGLRLARTALVSPFAASLTLSINVADGEGVAYAANPYQQPGVGFDDGNAATSTDAQMRFGRLRLTNAYGSELLALPVPLTAKYWNGQGFTANTLDNCTALAAPTLTYFAQTANNQLASGETSASYNAPLVAGAGNLRLAAPGVGNFGYLDLTLSAPVWLQYNWDGTDQDGDGNLFDDSPRARASFGKRNNASQVIIRREIY